MWKSKLRGYGIHCKIANGTSEMSVVVFLQKSDSGIDGDNYCLPFWAAEIFVPSRRQAYSNVWPDAPVRVTEEGRLMILAVSSTKKACIHG